ncbi:MAG: hypothetical protein M0T80_01050 [Actinomycetota bacterium]|nr:hypothetical protein [Actinomycetota bacterium]
MLAGTLLSGECSGVAGARKAASRSAWLLAHSSFDCGLSPTTSTLIVTRRARGSAWLLRDHMGDPAPLQTCDLDS